MITHTSSPMVGRRRVSSHPSTSNTIRNKDVLVVEASPVNRRNNVLGASLFALSCVFFVGVLQYERESLRPSMRELQILEVETAAETRLGMPSSGMHIPEQVWSVDECRMTSFEQGTNLSNSLHFVTPLNKVIELSTNVGRGLSAYSHYATPRQAFNDDHDVTLVTHADLQSLELFASLVAAWQAPVSMSVQLDSFEQLQLLDIQIQRQEFALTSFHVLVKNPNCSDGTSVPASFLHNVALQAATSPCVFATEPLTGGFAHAEIAAQLLPGWRSNLTHLNQAIVFSAPAPPVAGRSWRGESEQAVGVLACKRAGMLPPFNTFYDDPGANTTRQWAARLLRRGYALRVQRSVGLPPWSRRPCAAAWCWVAGRPLPDAAAGPAVMDLPALAQGCARTDPHFSLCGFHAVARGAAVAVGAAVVPDPTDGDFRAFPLLLRARQVPRRQEVTLAVQGGTSKLSRLVLLARQYKGPVAAAVAVNATGEAVREVLEFLLRHAEALQRTDVSVLLGPTQPFPVNHARNLAASTARTDLLLQLDSDLVPSPDLHAQLLRRLMDPVMRAGLCHGKVALIVPAWMQRRVGNASDDEVSFRALPKNKAELVQQVEEGKVTAFDKGDLKPCHGATNFSRWLPLHVREDIYKVDWEPRFEPYILLEKGLHGLLPSFDVRFKGYGRNKVSWEEELHLAGWEYHVLAEGFLVHLYHAGRDNRFVPKRLWNFYWDFQARVRRKHLDCSDERQRRGGTTHFANYMNHDGLFDRFREFHDERTKRKMNASRTPEGAP